jgi:hypothetical protein
MGAAQTLATPEKTAEEQLLDVIGNEVAKIISARRGSGATVDDPCRLGAMHALLAPMTEKCLVSSIYGQENVQWFDAGREYHKNGTICEQRVRLGDRVNPKPTWARPGKTYLVFFDISELTHEAPIPDTVKGLLMKGALQMPLRDATLVSRFPLIEIRAKNAAEAARIIAGHLRAAEAQGWKAGRATALVDNWRNEYELTRGNEKTVMQFDMRPCLLSDSPLNLTGLTLLAVNPQLETGLREFENLARPKPPPLPTPQAEPPQWFYYVNQRRHGPVSQEALISMIQDGTIDEKTIARPADDPTKDGGWRIEDLQKWQKKLPPVRRVFPPLPPNASKAQQIIRAFEEKHGKLLTEMTPSQLSDFTSAVTEYQGLSRPSGELIAFFKGTAAEPILRRERYQYNKLIPIVVLALILAIGVGIAAAFKVAALTQSPVLGLIGGLIGGGLLWVVTKRILSKVYE